MRGRHAGRRGMPTPRQCTTQEADSEAERLPGAHLLARLQAQWVLVNVEVSCRRPPRRPVVSARFWQVTVLLIAPKDPVASLGNQILVLKACFDFRGASAATASVFSSITQATETAKRAFTGGGRGVARRRRAGEHGYGGLALVARVHVSVFLFQHLLPRHGTARRLSFRETEGQRLALQRIEQTRKQLGVCCVLSAVGKARCRNI